MKQLHLLLSVCAAGAYSFSAGAAVTAESCSLSHIKQVADEEGLNKARALSADCIQKGYLTTKEAVQRGWATAKEESGDGYDDAKRTVKEGYEAAKDGAVRTYDAAKEGLSAFGAAFKKEFSKD